MAQLRKSAVSLRIIGDDLIPSEITALLGASPTHGQTKGEKFPGKTPGKERIARFGMWRLQAAEREPEDMDGQIREILSQLTDDLTIWRSIKGRYDVELFCGLFMKGSNEGLTISADSLATLGSRGIEMGLDIYGGHEPE